VLADARWLAKISCHVLMCRSVDAGLPVRRAGRRGARPRVIAGLCDLSTAGVPREIAGALEALARARV
jgi:NCAIR mutase (PurE)-related protein